MSKVKQAATPDEFWFDERKATVAVRFFERLLRHSKGEWAGKAFKLQPWQRDDVIRPLFGWMRKDGTRKYRTAYIEIPRKNGKSTLGSGIANYLMFADGEQGAEVYSAAADKEQAAIVFNEAKAMVQESPLLAARSEVYKTSITYPGARSFYRVLSAEAYTKHGLNPHGVVFDEVHAQPSRDLVDVLATGVGARRQPLIVYITTAGFDRNSICWELHEYARKIKAGIIEDPSWFVYIAAADEKDDWTKEETWKKANPSYGVTIKADYFEEQVAKAKQTPAYENTFRRLHLDQWTQQETRWLQMEMWDKCDKPINMPLLEGSACYGGLDLASTSDIAAFVLDFPNEKGEEEFHTWLPHFWIPLDNMIERARKDRVPYDLWVKQGLITATSGNTIDYDRIVKDIEGLGQRFNIKEIAFDRWGAFQVSNALTGAGFTMIGFGQGFVSMSTPTKELLRMVLNKRMTHGGHPVLRWMADNMIVSQDSAGNVKPEKGKSREKIDGMVAGVMALDRATRHANADKGSVYAKRGLRTL